MRNKLLHFSTLVLFIFTAFITKAQPKYLIDIPTNSKTFTFSNGKLYFFSGNNLWRSDGTPGGSILVKNLGESPVDFASFIPFGNFTLFTTFSGEGIETLWRTDGTTNGTQKISSYKSINPLGEYNGVFYLAIDDGISGLELWKMSSTFVLSLVKDINPGPGNGFSGGLALSNGSTFFAARSNGTTLELWKTNGTTAGTSRVTTLPGNYITGFADVNNTLYFTIAVPVFGMTGYELWKSNGTTAGTILVQKFYNNDFILYDDVSNLMSYKGKLYFTAGFENFYDLMVSDGTSVGTSIIKRSIATDGFVKAAGLLNGYIYVSTENQGWVQIYRSDGTSAGTVKIYDVMTDDTFVSPAVAGNKLYFVDHDGPSYFGTADNPADENQLFQTDLTPQGTKSVRSLFPGTTFRQTSHIIGAGDKLFFTLSVGAYSTTVPPDKLQLYFYDPTITSTPLPSLTLVNAGTDLDIKTLKDGDTIVKPKGLSINIRYNPVGTIGSVVFKLADTVSRIESGAPYALAGDVSGNYYPWTGAKQGKYKLTAIPYTLAAGKGTAGTPLVINFTIVEPDVNTPPVVSAGADRTLILPNNAVTIVGNANDPDGIKTLLWTKVSGPAATMASTTTLSLNLSNLVEGQYQFRLTATDNKGASASDDMILKVSKAGQSVVSYTLINADTDSEIKTLVENETLDLSKLSTKNLNIRINTNPASVGSVKIVYDNGFNRFENVAPYSMFGDNNGNFNAGTFNIGFHTLTVTPYTGTNGSGTAGNALTLHFNVIKSVAAKEAADIESTEAMTISAYPIPSSYIVYFALPESINEPVEITIYNNKAELVTTLHGSKGELQWDSSKHAEGIYFAKYTMNGELKTLKLIVRK